MTCGIPSAFLALMILSAQWVAATLYLLLCKVNKSRSIIPSPITPRYCFDLMGNLEIEEVPLSAMDLPYETLSCIIIYDRDVCYSIGTPCRNVM